MRSRLVGALSFVMIQCADSAASEHPKLSELVDMMSVGAVLERVYHEEVLKDRPDLLAVDRTPYATAPDCEWISLFVDTTFRRHQAFVQNGEKTRVLDGAILKKYASKAGVFYGIGAADGHGGHTDDYEDYSIATLAAHAPEIILDKVAQRFSGVRILTEDAVERVFKESFEECAGLIKESFEYKTHHANTTMSAVLLFMGGKKRIKCVGFNYGDQHIAKLSIDKKGVSYRSISNGGTLDGGVPAYPDLGKHWALEYMPVNHTLDDHDYLVFATDGVVLPASSAPRAQDISVGEEQVQMTWYDVDDEAVSARLNLSGPPTAHAVNQAFVRCAYDYQNQKRLVNLETEGKDGDDVLSVVLGPITPILFAVPSRLRRAISGSFRVMTEALSPRGKIEVPLSPREKS